VDIQSRGRANSGGFTEQDLVELVLDACEESDDQTEIGDVVARRVVAEQPRPALRTVRTRAEERCVRAA